MTEVQQRRHFHSVMRRSKTEIVDGVMRDRERMKLDFADLKVAAGINFDDAIPQRMSALSRFVIRDPEASGLADISIARLRRNKNRAIKIFYQHPQAAAVIAMLVRHQNSIQRIRVLAEHRHAVHNFARTQSGVDQNTSAVGDQQHSVAGRSATEY